MILLPFCDLLANLDSEHDVVLVEDLLIVVDIWSHRLELADLVLHALLLVSLARSVSLGPVPYFRNLGSFSRINKYAIFAALARD